MTLLAVTLCVTDSGSAAAQEDGILHFNADRIVVVGDVHGAYDRLVELLEASGVVNAKLHWTGGTTHLVSLGDVLDRGAGARPAVDLLMRLQSEAAAAGGRVHVLLGNHELMNLLGDLRYVPDSELASFVATGTATTSDTPDPTLKPGQAERHAAFTPDGAYGSWLLAQPAVLVINDTAFVHGGLPPAAAALSPTDLDRAVKSRLAELLDLRTTLEQAGIIESYGDIQAEAARLEAAREATPAARGPAQGEPGTDATSLEPAAEAQVARFIELANDELLGSDSVMWYRGTALCHELLERPVLEAVLDRWQVARVVVGHTPTWDSRVRERFGGRALLADTGMLESVYHGQPAAIVIEGDSTRVLYPELGTQPDAPTPRDGLEFDGIDLATTERILAEGHIAPAPQAAVADPTSDQSTPLRATLPPDAAAVEVTLGDARLAALFEPGSGSDLDRQVAAYRLDRLLGLNLVVPVAVRQYQGKQGVVSARWHNTLDEQARAAGRLARENWCAVGSDYQLLYAFDALVRNMGRTSISMIYDRRTWQLASQGHANTFGRGRDLPPYLVNAPKVIPPALAERLRALDAAELAAALGDQLSKAQLRAILARRDDLLSTWNATGTAP